MFPARSWSPVYTILALLTAVFTCGQVPAAEPNDTRLPLKKVVMFNSGVGFFEHRGEVTGDASLQLKFNVDDINDLLKSMVVQDLGGGRISTVTYGSKDPITKTLRTFAIDLTSNPTLGELLNQIRGERVQVDAPNAINGIILGVEKRRKEVGPDKQPVEIELLNLLTEEGLRTVPLESIGRIKLADPEIDAELRQALAVLALGHSTDKKTVSLSFLGNGQRRVRVGYIQETPVWKTSYRLVLSDEAPLLQGWAIVENTTEEDWNDVDLTLVSGRPISFIMDLYQPLYVDRPVVEPELYASLRPQTYGQDLAAREGEFRRMAEQQQNGAAVAKRGAFGRGLADEKAAAMPAAAAPMRKQDGLARADMDRNAGWDASARVQSMAQADNVGELFQYSIATPVKLPRQQSAMLPIVNESIKAEKVSIYNQNVQSKHPLNGLQLTNSTELHLMQGPITVFDDGTYAGDARIEDLPPGTKRLVSYALDLDTEVAPEAKVAPQQLVSVRLAKGTLYVSHKMSRSQKYTVKNSGKRSKKVLVEWPITGGWNLVSPKEPEEKTRDLYRFAVPAEPGKPATLTIDEEQIVHQQLLVSNLDDNTILSYVSQKVVSDAVKKSLEEIVQRKRAIQKVVVDRQRLEAQIKVIDQEQDRVRQNMAQLDRNTDLYKRYVQKFSTQEDEVEKLREQIKTLAADEAKLRQQLDDYLTKLDLS